MGSSYRARLSTTWAPRGQPPVLRRRDKRREVSSIVALVLWPRGRRPRAGVFARHIPGSFDSESTCRALPYFRKKAGCPLVLVWDRANAHRSKYTLAFIARHPRDYRLEWLPAHAPELNPEEGCNSVVKSEMSNIAPTSDDEMRALVRAAFRRVARRPDMLQALIRHAGLSLT
jgi:transposase